MTLGYYRHFTSPIRRYPDLVVHRSLRRALEEADDAGWKGERSELSRWAEQASQRERLAEEAERETVELKKVEYMQRYLGDVFPGRVSGVVPYGIFVQLDNTVEGLVHVSTMTGDYYQYLEDRLALVGEHTGKVYRIGFPVQVRVVRADPEARQVDFELIE
ncbi:MAG: S1 RNA-binding domain-containing protein [Clostridia bacterium]|nr:MAG: S1 RNA-binding domain-containing protein [Clostridia bacterium]